MTVRYLADEPCRLRLTLGLDNLLLPLLLGFLHNEGRTLRVLLSNLLRLDGSLKVS